MKKTLVYTGVLLLPLLPLLSCNKEQFGRSSSPAQPNQYIDASVASGETYTFVAGSGGTLSVSKQALHFQVSETMNENGSVYYDYKPAKGFYGDDEVTLTYLSDASGPGLNIGSGCPASHNTPAPNGLSTILIKQNVTK